MLYNYYSYFSEYFLFQTVPTTGGTIGNISRARPKKKSWARPKKKELYKKKLFHAFEVGQKCSLLYIGFNYKVRIIIKIIIVNFCLIIIQI